MKIQKEKKERGFSLIELLVAILIFVLLGAITLAGLSLSGQKSKLDKTAQEIIIALRSARNKTLTAENAKNYGVYFETNQFILFSETPSNTYQQYPLEPSLIISEINLDQQQVLFARPAGVASTSGTIVLQDKNDSEKNKTIYVDTSGLFGLEQEMVASDQQRQKDSRHVHAFFSQNTQNANLLTLYFPADSFTYQVNYQDYLSPDKSSFLWEGTVQVGEEDQTLKIHSHLLNDVQTQFCFHRNINQNSKAVTINLDGENLINYTSDNQAITGSSIFISEPQPQ